MPGPAMHVGFTGTQQGMTQPQGSTVARLLWTMAQHGYTTFHHGDCIGADEQADWLAREASLGVELHPGPDGPRRAHCERRGPTIVHPSAAYLVRNTHIVRDSQILIAAPKRAVEEWRGSGTWATIRRARQKGLPRYLVLPDGRILPEGMPPDA